MYIDVDKMLTAIMRAEGKSIPEFAEMLGVSWRVVAHALQNKSCSDTLVKALSEHYGADYSFLQRRDNRGRPICTGSTNTKART